MEKKPRVSKETMRKMRAYAIKQALSEVKDDMTPNQVEYIAHRHLLNYAELKEAIKNARS